MMSQRLLVGAALVAVAVLGFAWFTMTPTATLPTPTPPDSTTGSTTTTFTLAEVATHGNITSCWSVINGKVYNLTAWINQHPGGAQRILSICGTDGSSAFNAQHSGQARPANELTNFLIGTLTQ